MHGTTIFIYKNHHVVIRGFDDGYGIMISGEWFVANRGGEGPIYKAPEYLVAESVARQLIDEAIELHQ